MVELREGSEKPLRQETNFSTRLIFQLWLEQLEEMVSSRYHLAKKSRE